MIKDENMHMSKSFLHAFMYPCIHLLWLSKKNAYLLIFPQQLRRLVTNILSDPITYYSKWDSTKTTVASIIHNLKEETFESSCSRQDALKKNLNSVVSS